MTAEPRSGCPRPKAVDSAVIHGRARDCRLVSANWWGWVRGLSDQCALAIFVV